MNDKKFDEMEIGSTLTIKPRPDECDILNCPDEPTKKFAGMWYCQKHYEIKSKSKNGKCIDCKHFDLVGMDAKNSKCKVKTNYITLNALKTLYCVQFDKVDTSLLCVNIRGEENYCQTHNRDCKRINMLKSHDGSCPALSGMMVCLCR